MEKENRRIFLKRAGVWASLSPALAAIHLRGASRQPSRSAGSRLALRNRRRRVVWNNDGSDLQAAAYGRGKWPIPLQSPDQFLGNLMKYVEGTQVDSIFYNGHTNEADWEFPSTYIQALGPNPLRHGVEFAHKNGMEFFYSIRMNDVHASYWPPNRGYWVPFRLQHPELLLGYTTAEEFEQKFMPWIRRFLDIERERQAQGVPDSPEERTKLRFQAETEHPLADVIRRHGQFSQDLWSWASYNYARPEVQDRYLEVIEGACRRYDVDGVELDWCRMPFYFKLGQERRNIPIMNDFVHQVRRRLDHYGERRGRPILLAMRVPDSVELCLSTGLDPETWARQDWVDLFMAGSGLMPFSIPMEEWMELGRRYGIPIYGCLDRLHPIFRTGRPRFFVDDPPIDEDDPSAYRFVWAAAHRFWKAGVDGIYLYDWFTHGGPSDPDEFGTVPKVGEPAPLARLDKLYQIDPGFPVRPGMGALDPACVPAQLPRSFAPRAGAARLGFQLAIAEDPRRAQRAALQTQWNEDMDSARAGWTLNGVPLGKPRPFVPGGHQERPYLSGLESNRGWVEYPLPEGVLQEGGNRLEVIVTPARPETSPAVCELLQVRVFVSYT